MAPKNARLVFLSATIPNAKEFADWVAKVHQQPCHIIYTDYRPTPLQHYLFSTGGNGLYSVVDEKGKFHEDSFQKALNALVLANEKKDSCKWQKGLVNGRAGEDSDIFKMIIQRQYDPLIVFSLRGINDRGVCILVVDEKLEPSTAKLMVKGGADLFDSAFHLSYNMRLNQLRSEDGDPENLLCNSFYQFQADRAIPDLEIDNLSSVRLIIAKDLLPLEIQENTLKKVSEVLSRFFSKQGIPLLDPEEGMEVQSGSYRKAVRKILRL